MKEISSLGEIGLEGTVSFKEHGKSLKDFNPGKSLGSRNSILPNINKGKDKFQRKKVLSLIQEYAQIGVGVLLASIGLKAFLLPNGFLDGGVTGIAILISEKLQTNVSVLLFTISLPFLVLGWFTVSRKVVYKSLVSILALSVIIHLENFMSITDDKLLISIFGGIFLGAGIGLAVKNGAVLDGSEILGIFVNDRLGISIGRVVLVFNIVLFTITALILSIEVAMYSILTYLVTAKMIDFTIQGFEDYVGLMIVSRKDKLLENELLQRVGSGLTVYNGNTGYGKNGVRNEVRILHLVVNRFDIRRTYNAINSIDDEAFIIEFDVNNVKGGLLRRYLAN